MKTISQPCHKCHKHPNIVIDKDNVQTSCHCGYYTWNVNEIIEFRKELNLFKQNTNFNKSKTFSDIINDINKGYEHLATYFMTIKNEKINHLLSTINSIESSYEESYKRNMNMLSYLEILIDNYDGSIKTENNIMKNKINISKCKENPNIDDIIKYYNEYYIVENKKKINIEEIKCIKTITDHTDCVYSLLLLKDKRIASCSYDNTIRIYDPLNDYHCDQVIKGHSGFNEMHEDEDLILTYPKPICVLEDGTIVSGQYNSLKIGDYTIKNAHNNDIYKVIALPNNRIASSSRHNKIKIWKSNPPYSDTPIKVLLRHDRGPRFHIISILYMNERDIMISSYFDTTICLWNMSTYQLETVFKGFQLDSQLDDNRVIVYDKQRYILNINKCIIEKKIKNEVYAHASTNCIKLKDNIILCGYRKQWWHGILLYDINTEETKYMDVGVEDELLRIDDNTFLACSGDNTINVWKYQ